MGELTRCGEVYELAISIEEQLAAGSAELFSQEELVDLQLALGVRRRLADSGERDTMLTTAALEEKGFRPGMVSVVQTFGGQAHFNPHVHARRLMEPRARPSGADGRR